MLHGIVVLGMVLVLLQTAVQINAVSQVLSCLLSYWRYKTTGPCRCIGYIMQSWIVQRCSDVCSAPHVHVMLRADREPEASALPDVCSITIFCLISGRSLSSWAQRLRSQDFQLLCRNGNTADVTEWRTCHLARIPAHAVVVRPDTDGTVVFQLLNRGQVGHHFFISALHFRGVLPPI